MTSSLAAHEPTARSREDDPRLLRSRQALIDALIDLVDADPQQPISITRLVEAAGVTRPTFYQHFPDIPAALQAAALDRMAKAFPKMAEDDAGRPLAQRVSEQVLVSLVHLDRYRPFYLRVVETAGSAAFFSQLVTFVKDRMVTDVTELDTVHDGTPLRDIVDIVAGGSMWLVVDWLRGEQRGTPRSIAARIAAMASFVHHNKTQARRAAS